MKTLNTNWRLLLFLPLLMLLHACKKDEEETPDAAAVTPGELISYELIKTISLSDVNFIQNQLLTAFLNGSTMPVSNYQGRFSAPRYAVKLYKVTYQTVVPEQGNRGTVAHGLIAIPDVDTTGMPMISYQHGTVFSKYWVPSYPDSSAETQFMIAQFAAQGYVLIAADYIGVGPTATEKNTYFVRKSTEQACLDMYRASRKVLEQEQIPMTKFFVNGWSQGGLSTMLFLRRLEQENIPVRAAFTAAAPVDPLFFLTRGLFNPRSFDAFFTVAAFCNLIQAVEKYNNLSGISARYIRPEYLDAARKFYNFEITFEQFVDTVPIQLQQAFTQELYDDAAQADTRFWEIMSASEAYRWLSPTPLRAYYGGRDEAVPDFIAKLAVDYMTTIGKQDAQAFSAGDSADHRATYIESILDAKSWVDGF